MTVAICRECKAERPIETLRQPCACGATEWDKQRCGPCKVGKLEEDMTGYTGNLLWRVAKIESMLEAGVVYTPDDLTAEEARGLEILKEERNKREAEVRAAAMRKK